MQQFAGGFDAIGGICGRFARRCLQNPHSAAPVEVRLKCQAPIALPQMSLLRPLFGVDIFCMPRLGARPAADASGCRGLRPGASAGCLIEQRSMSDIFNICLKNSAL
ncbi:hypothetical protein IP84_10015 [beta proteobacterium AAP99]|nr:hypothetical protein IP84_10015 [beta proteobacterium AAP99]